MLADMLIIITGVVVTIWLSTVVVNNAVELARRFHVSGSFIGLTVLSVGTSIPEIFTQVVGSISILNDPETYTTISGLVIGTSIGSDIFQQNFVLPVVGLVGTIVVRRASLYAEIGVLMGSVILVWLFGLGGELSRLEGITLVLAYAAYLCYLAKSDRGEEGQEETVERSEPNGRRSVLGAAVIAVCFVVMAVATQQVLDAAARFVQHLPVSASFFGVVVLGVAAALPELTTSLVSIFKGRKEISAGILIGSNITNPLLAIGLGAAISGYAVPDVVVYYDLPVNIATAGALFVFLWTREDLARWEAVVLIALYVAYVVARPMLFPGDF